ncbi:MAG: alpha/beta fold hydrolase [Betaproteobacteria bacterium]|nr:alpha/beta fold hydrolase [Betaproteobacteria bacterium]MBU6510745.1 alpha/beta fold hydrolase [Betaproteobacteria bacterium]MDE1956051.1 alpha/beta fold hydrolase [Betaproteobacteria bacterium]MDE2151747.1 alpha/beta fold hydrolase [Betaproteobacteria bacterium]MDE2477405.1 alpha/beta fold hydrolase [Betaproteobacteria bacterium]
MPAHVPPPRPSHLLYLHGFRSSPASAKARLTLQGLRELQRGDAPPVAWICPQLPPSPREAMELCLALVREAAPSRLVLIGSSLGGFYATWLAERLDCRAALLNPAVNPARDLRAQIGELDSWHDPSLRFRFTAEHVRELHAYEVGDLGSALPHPERYLAVIARDDEVLDWREMSQRYRGCELRLAEHGGHALDDYAQAHRDAVLAFLGLRAD